MEVYDFVRKYVHFFSGLTDAPKEFQEAAGLFLLSTAIGRRWIFRSLPETAIFSKETSTTGKLLNLWFIILGKSRISRKSSGVMSHAEQLVKRVIGDQQLLSEAFTPEALIKELSEKSKRSIDRHDTVCCWICDEIAWFFNLLKKRDSYMASADAFLSKIYDGSTHSRSTTGRGKETIWNPYLTCLLASTDYLPTLFDELRIRLGFMNRFIYVVGKREKRKPLRTEPLTEEERKEVREIIAFLEALHRRTSVTILEMTGEAKQIYDSFEGKIEKRIAGEDLGIKEGYWGQLPNLVVRLSCLYRISRMRPEEIQNYSEPILTVEKQDVHRAIKYAEKAWKWFEKVIEIMHEPRVKSSTRVTQTNRGKSIVMEILKDGSKKREELLPTTRRAGISDSTVDNQILPSLIKDDLIKRDKSGWYSLIKERVNDTHSEGGEVE